MNYYKDLLIRYINFNSYKKASIYDRINSDSVFNSVGEAISHLDKVNKDAAFMRQECIQPSFNIELYMINIIDEVMLMFLRECIKAIHNKYVKPTTDNGEESSNKSVMLDKALIDTMKITISEGDNVNKLIESELSNYTDVCMKYIDKFDSEETTTVMDKIIDISIVYYNIMQALHTIAATRNRSDKYFSDMVDVYKHLGELTLSKSEINDVMTKDVMYDITV